MQISNYTDVAVNGNGPLFTHDTTLTLAGGGWKGSDLRLGGCDHMMKNSLKAIVQHYTRRVKKEGLPGTHTVEIVYGEGFRWEGNPTTTVSVEITL